MRCSCCGVCCTETEMLLSKEDIQRIAKKGFNKKYFIKIDKYGYAQLRNRNGYCVFYDLDARLCSIYSDRPFGCRVYPVILDEDVGIVVDVICSERNSVTFKEKSEKGQVVLKLLRVIDEEAKCRCKNRFL
ncbi:MAG: YkgJ family cysteine cluster protein [Candidatus Bathyarchaeota archaeon]|nr:YkgJ family cysteine cluster protein [Candidatus Termiticorpusculum sp.]